MAVRTRSAGALVVLALLAGACSNQPNAPTTFQLLGWLNVVAQLADGAGNPTGTSVLTTADSVVVRLIGGAMNTRTVAGQWLFQGIANGTYHGSCEVGGVPTDTTRAVLIQNLDIATTDTLKVQRIGDLVSWPNPFTTSTRFQFALAANDTVTFRIVTIAGSPVRTLVDHAPLPAGVHAVIWDGNNDAAAAVPNGWYAGVLTGPAGPRVEIVIKGP
jgi:hypothetical protein